MDVNYGQAVKDYLLKEVNLLRIHRFAPKDVQFDYAQESRSPLAQA
jgi:adenine-specific DNA-methyltransferase